MEKTFNEHVSDRPPIEARTEQMLKRFYAPFNERLVELLQEKSSSSSSSFFAPEKFRWDDVWAAHSQTKAALGSRWNDHNDPPPNN